MARRHGPENDAAHMAGMRATKAEQPAVRDVPPRPTFDVGVDTADRTALVVACQLCGYVKTYEYEGCEDQGHDADTCDCYPTFVGGALDDAESVHKCPKVRLVKR